VFTAWYALSPCIKKTRLVFKGLSSLQCIATFEDLCPKIKETPGPYKTDEEKLTSVTTGSGRNKFSCTTEAIRNICEEVTNMISQNATVFRCITHRKRHRTANWCFKGNE